MRVEPVNTGGELRLPYADLWRKDDAASVSVGMRNACSAEQQYTGMVDVVIRSGVAGVHIPAMVVVEAEVDPFPSGIKESRTMYLRNEKRVSALVGVLAVSYTHLDVYKRQGPGDVYSPTYTWANV